MIMKVPSCGGVGGCGGGFYTSYGGDQPPPYDIDSDDYDSQSHEDFDSDFSEYLWMENEEEFDKNEMQRLDDEALMEQCVEAMLQDEIHDVEIEIASWSDPIVSVVLPQTISSNDSYYDNNDDYYDDDDDETDISQSTLNPLAAEFIPTPPPPLVHAST